MNQSKSPILAHLDTSHSTLVKAKRKQLTKQIESFKGHKLSSPEKVELRELNEALRILKDDGVPFHHELLAESLGNGFPKWAMVNPYKKISEINGRVFCDYGTRKYTIETNTWRTGSVDIELGGIRRHSRALQPKSGFPRLPQRIRDLLKTRRFKTSHATAILYCPSAWSKFEVEKPDPDPALVVQWRPGGQWLVQAVWGHDGPHIEEFMG